jgi:nicotinamide-nucleotide adenylyltransferase
MPADEKTMRQPLPRYAAALKSFADSSSNFRVIHSHSTASLSPPKIVYILDSSFNPPTIAHMQMVTSAVISEAKSSPSPKRILLLLATQNADKAPKPASFEHRLTMMELFASDIREALSKNISNEGSEDIGLDIGVTKLPYFVDKATAIKESNTYPSFTENVHLTGYDTLIRLLDPKYYPPERSLKVLEPFFAGNRLRVTYRRFEDGVDGKLEQDAYLTALQEGERDLEGGNRRWVTGGRIEMCEGREGEVVSSTLVREAVSNGDEKQLKKLVPSEVSEWIIKNKLYTEN